MAKKLKINNKRVNQLTKLALGIGTLFMLLLFVVPLLPVKDVALGAEPTAYQSFVKFFVDAQGIFVNNIIVIGALFVLILLFYKFSKK